MALPHASQYSLPPAHAAMAARGGPGTEIDGLVANWDFQPSQVSLDLRLRRVWNLVKGLRRAPHHQTLVPVREQACWMLYFIFAPEGSLTSAHEFTLARLRDMGLPLLVVCAAPEPGQVPERLRAFADALYWKALDGYDFSAYALGLHAVAAESPGATVCVMNDSVFGPFVDMRPFIAAAPWQLTGFTASSLIENHLQSYAFVMHDVRAQTLAPLASVLPTRFAFKRGIDVVLHQELCFARKAARHGSVGAFWFSPDSKVVADPTLMRPFELVAAGFPFVKRSLMGKHSKFQDSEAVVALLRELGHPVPPGAGQGRTS